MFDSSVDLRNIEVKQRVAGFYVEAHPIVRSCVRRLIFLARHGSHAELGHILSGRSDIALNPAGRAEAERLARRLADTPLAAIHTSPRRRTRETADIVAQRQGVAVTPVDALDEIDFGRWSGRRFAELDADADWFRWNSERASAATPAGDTMAAATGRAVDHIEGVDEAGPVLLVSHCDVIRGVAAHYLGISADRLLSFACDPGSLTILAREAGQTKVMTLNECPQ